MDTVISYAYVGNPAVIFKTKEAKNALSVYTEGVADIIYDRDAKHQLTDTKIDFYGASAGVVLLDFFSLYGGAGGAKATEEFIATANKDIRWKSDYGFAWLVGGRLKLFDKNIPSLNSNRLLADIDIQYRNTRLDSDSITIDGTEYSMPNDAISYSSMEYNDWHVALSVALDFKRFSPYAGLKYSDFESCLRVMQGGLLYEKDNVEADNNLGVFVGISINILDNLTAQAEASFIDENSVSALLTVSF